MPTPPPIPLFVGQAVMGESPPLTAAVFAGSAAMRTPFSV